MKKFLLIARQDENSPCALELKLRLIRGDDEIDVILINVPYYKLIPWALFYLHERIQKGVVPVSEEDKKYIQNLNDLIKNRKNRTHVPSDVVRLIRKELGFSWLMPAYCILLKNS